MNIQPSRTVGVCRTANVSVSYDRIVEVLGFEPNVTDLDDQYKVKASWGFTVDGEECGIWCYYFDGDPRECRKWSFYGPDGIADKLFL
jgi:hypothetical protein